MIYPAIIGALATADQFLKQAIEKDKEGVFPRELHGSKGKILLYRNHNSGFSFGFLKEYPDLIRAVPLAGLSAFGGILGFLSVRKGYFLHKASLCLILAGGASNLYDRIVRGHVVDYFSIQWKHLKKLVLNLGDVFIFLGAFLFALSELLSWLLESPKRSHSSSSKKMFCLHQRHPRS